MPEGSPMKTLNVHQFFQSGIHRLFRKSTDNYSKLMGQVLMKRGLITDEQLRNALKVQKEKLYTLGKAVRLGQIIVELGYAQEQNLVKAVNDEYQISIKTLSDDIRGLVRKKRDSFAEGLPTPRIPIWLQFFGSTSTRCFVASEMIREN